MSQAARPGALLSEPALVLDKHAFGEADAMLHLLTLHHGRISAIALRARNSRKRFGAALEPSAFVQASLKAPRERHDEDDAIWRLEAADLQDSFLHLRSSMALLEAAFFALRLVRDVLPAGHADEALFRTLGRYLRDALRLCEPTQAPWLQLAFWTWWAHHQGVGDLSRDLEETLENAAPALPEYWRRVVTAPEADLAALAQTLKELSLPPLRHEQWLQIYSRWLELSGLTWPHWERHLRHGEWQARP